MTPFILRGGKQMGCARYKSGKARGFQGNSGRSCNAYAKRSLKYKHWCRSIFSILNIRGKDSTQRKSLFITIKEPDFSFSAFKDSERVPCKIPTNQWSQECVARRWSRVRVVDSVGCVCCKQIRFCQEQKQSFEFRLDLEVVVSALPTAERFR